MREKTSIREKIKELAFYFKFVLDKRAAGIYYVQAIDGQAHILTQYHQWQENKSEDIESYEYLYGKDS